MGTAGRGADPAWLLATLDAADTDAWRVRVREALAARDWQALEPMARAVDVRTQPPSFLVVVARKLPLPAQGGATRLELLRRIQGDLPGGFVGQSRARFGAEEEWSAGGGRPLLHGGAGLAAG